MSDGHATADMELSTSDTAVPAREEQTHVPEEAGATLIQDGSTQGHDPAAGQTFVVNGEFPPRNGQGAATVEAQTLIAPPDQNSAVGKLGATVIADGTTGEDGAEYRFGATVVDHTAAGHSDGFQMGATVVGGDDPAVGATRRADAVSSLDPARPGDELDLQPGESLIGRFRVLKVLGEGSFGAVYLAEDPQLDRRVAIKVTKVGVLTTRSDVDRFQREAKAAAQLRHPNIVPVYEVGRIGRSSFLAYEYIEGRTLGSRLKEEKKLPPQTAAQLMLAIASALGYAHELGIIHRDMKPDNILLDRQGQPHIADFGLARRDSGEMDKTREGGLMGTPLYMSPEQASGRSHEADARSDVWSLGVMLRELLTGVLPFQGKLTEILIGIQSIEPPSIRALDPSLPKDLETICQKCLAKDPAQRYANGTELAEELDRYLRGEPIKARPLNMPARMARWVRRNPKEASLIAGIFAVLLFGLSLSSYFAYEAMRQSREKALAKLTNLKSATPGSVPSMLDDLRGARDDIAAQLDSDLSNGRLGAVERNRLLLAKSTLFPEHPGQDERLVEIAQTLVKLPADEVAIQVGELLAHRDQVVEPLRRIADNRQDLQTSRMALYALATLSDGKLSEADIDNAAAGLLALGARDRTAVLELIDPVRERIGPELERSFDQSQSGVQAANVLAELYRKEPARLFRLSLKASPQQLQPLLTAMKEHREQIAELARGELSPAQDDAPLSPEQLRSRTNAFLVMYVVAPQSVDWTVLSGRRDNSLRSEIIRALPDAVPDWRHMGDRLRSEPDPLVRQALLLMLANFPAANIPTEDRSALRSLVVQLFNEDQSPAVHSAARSYLRTTGAEEQLVSASARPLSISDRGDKHWFRNSQGQEFAIVSGPVEFLMGAGPDDVDCDPVTERRHRRLIPRSFAIGMHEVTVHDYLRFNPNHEYNPVISPDPHCPITELNWIAAAKYCRWLSEQEGIPEEEMCFPPADRITAYLQLPPDVLQRTGYRLPTAAEWEFACRAGTQTVRWIGNVAPDQIERCAWFRDISDGRTHPVGLTEPNCLGLFDTLGNAAEFCHDLFFEDYPVVTEGQPVIDGVEDRDGIDREARTTCYDFAIRDIRVSLREGMPPDEPSTYVGFRLARTVRQ